MSDSANKIKIVVVEDEVSIQNLYKFKLELEGYEVFIANNGQEGLEVIEETKPALVLLDLMMPVMSGEEMLHKLRAEKWASNIRVIILTNISKDEVPKSLSLLSVDRYIVKAHYTPTQVLEIVKEVLNVR